MAEQHRASWFFSVLAVGLALSLSGCILGSDSGEPVLAVDLYWDENPRPDRFAGGTCGTAGVSWMEWRLVDANGDTVVKSGKGGEECQDGFTFDGFRPGTYELEITGYDDQDVDLWSTLCTGLTLDRFDQLYACEIDQ